MATKDQQVREVVDGMGLGLVALGVTRVTSSKLPLDFAFIDAWHRWEYAGSYPSIGGLKPESEFRIGLLKSADRRWPVVRWVQAGKEYQIDIGSRTVDEAADALGRPLDDWISLAEPFIARLNQHG